MKKSLAILSLITFALGAGMAFAADGEAIYGSCAGCHGEKGEKGNNPLKDQSADELLKKLKGYADGSYGGEKKGVMVNIVKKHNDEELKAVADFIGKK